MLDITELEIRRVANGYTVAPLWDSSRNTARLTNDIYVFGDANDLADWLNNWAKKHDAAAKKAQSDASEKAREKKRRGAL